MEPPRTVIGVDVGGTKTAAALLRVSPHAGALIAPAPEIIDRRTVLTDTGSKRGCLESMFACVSDLAYGSPAAEAIGVGVASMVDYPAGRIVESVNLPLTDVPLRELLRERFEMPAAIDNDATAAAIGEHACGVGVGTRDMIMLTLGTGVGGGIICDGRPYRGHSGAAAELGHIMIDVDGPPCPADCPNHGCLEAYVSGTAMGAVAVAEARAKPFSALGRALTAGEPVDSRLLTRLAKQGDSGAVALLTQIGEYLGAGLVTLVNAFNPELVVVGGGAAAADELLLGPARDVLAARALRPARDQVRVAAGALGGDAGIIGAGVLALERLGVGKPG